MILELLDNLSHLFVDAIVNRVHTNWGGLVSGNEPLRDRMYRMPQRLSTVLRDAYQKGVVVLIDEYDSPMHSAIVNDYAVIVPQFPFPLSSDHLQTPHRLFRCMPAILPPFEKTTMAMLQGAVSDLSSCLNPLSVIKVLEKNKISEFWVETGTVFRMTTWSELIAHMRRHAPLFQKLWRASTEFPGSLIFSWCRG
jgi:hypothetical protein